MGISLPEIDTSDGNTKRHHFDWAKNEPIVPRFTLDVSDDLIQQGTVVNTYSIIEKLPGVQGFNFAPDPNLPIGDAYPWNDKFLAENAANIIRWVRSDKITTHKGDPGGYILWFNGMTTRNFAASWDGEVFTYRVFAWVKNTDIFAISAEWYVVVSGQP